MSKRITIKLTRWQLKELAEQVARYTGNEPHIHEAIRVLNVNGNPVELSAQAWRWIATEITDGEIIAYRGDKSNRRGNDSLRRLADTIRAELGND